MRTVAERLIISIFATCFIIKGKGKQLSLSSPFLHKPLLKRTLTTFF